MRIRLRFVTFLASVPQATPDPPHMEWSQYQNQQWQGNREIGQRRCHTTDRVETVPGIARQRSYDNQSCRHPKQLKRIQRSLSRLVQPAQTYVCRQFAQLGEKEIGETRQMQPPDGRLASWPVPENSARRVRGNPYVAAGLLDGIDQTDQIGDMAQIELGQDARLMHLHGARTQPKLFRDFTVL